VRHGPIANKNKRLKLGPDMYSVQGCRPRRWPRVSDMAMWRILAIAIVVFLAGSAQAQECTRNNVTVGKGRRRVGDVADQVAD
jgi:hypothetical protein